MERSSSGPPERDGSGADRRRLLHTVGVHTRRIHKSRSFDVFVGIGLVTYGIVHLLIAWIAVRIALSGQDGNDTQDAALEELAQSIAGEALLWITAAGLGALTLWQVFETIWRRDPNERPVAMVFGRVGSGCSAIGYFALGVSTARVAYVGHEARNGRRVQSLFGDAQLDLLRALVLVVGVIFVALAVRNVYRGLRRRFTADLKDSVNPKIVVFGQIGYVGKGITYTIIGVMLVVVAVDGRTGPPGLQTILRLLNISPAGGVVLLLKALGLAMFGAYCFAWAANRRR